METSVVAQWVNGWRKAGVKGRHTYGSVSRTAGASLVLRPGGQTSQRYGRSVQEFNGKYKLEWTRLLTAQLASPSGTGIRQVNEGSGSRLEVSNTRASKLSWCTAHSISPKYRINQLAMPPVTGKYRHSFVFTSMKPIDQGKHQIVLVFQVRTSEGRAPKA